jgi:hypothetical protein
VRLLSAGRVALGLSIALLPRHVTRPWIGRDARRPATATVARAHGVREALLGVVALQCADRPQEGARFLQALSLVDAADLGATYAARRALPRTSTPLIAALAGAAIAVQLSAARRLQGEEAAARDGRMGRGPTALRGLVLALTALALVWTPAARAEAGAAPALDARAGGGDGAVPAHFVGLSIEWSLIERYMGPAARPAFANLLRNLGSGELRIGGSSQDLMPFDPAAPNSNRVITPEDLGAIRATLDAANVQGYAGEDDRERLPGWAAILGTALAPPGPERPWVGPEHARSFVTQGVLPAFADGGQREIVGIGLGNEPDISYAGDVARYLADLATYRDANVTGPLAIVAPSTSEQIAPWQALQARSVDTRFFWDWPSILDVIAPAMNARRGPFGALATDHFYPAARGCATNAYRCATIERVLSDERFANLGYVVYTHAAQAAERGLGYRLQETNTAAGRGVDGVSNVAASATWSLRAMFEAACPQPPDQPGANAGCRTGAIGINLHNAEVDQFFAPEEGNAFYNPILYDPTPAAGPPTAAPSYYALLLFSRFAQGSRGLRPIATPPGSQLNAWQVDAGEGRRLFVVNSADHPQAVGIAAARARYELDRMTPFDPAGGPPALAAPQVRIDGRAVAADGSWPGFAPQTGRIGRRPLALTLAPGEAAVLTLGRE